MKTKRLSYWLTLGLTLLFAVNPLIAAEHDIQLTEKVLASAEAKYGPNARRRLVAWTNLIITGKKKTEAEKLKLVNSFINRVPYMSDKENWGKAKYWATPVEMLASNGGDAEDYAIAKYFTLLAIGVSMERLQITYVNAMSRPAAEQAHMVITYYSSPDSMPLVLDNIDPEIKPASERPDLSPIYSFNGDGLWVAKERSSGNSDVSSNVNLWNEMNARMGKELLPDDSSSLASLRR